MIDLTKYRSKFTQNMLEVELLEDRLMLSTIQVFAAGETGEESMNLSVDGQVIQTWNNIGGNYSSGDFETFSVTTSGIATPEQVRVSFTNDGVTADGSDKNLRVDKIRIDNIDYESEAPETYIEGTWLSATGCSAGNLQSEFMHCGGFIQYSPQTPTGNGSQIVVRMAGDTGEEQVTLSIAGQVASTWNNVGGDFESRQFVEFTYDHSAIVTPDQVRITHTNDGLTSAGLDKNLHLDRISIDGEIYEAEDASVLVTGLWVSGAGCSEGFLQSETTHCGGYFQFDQIDPPDSNGSVINVRAAGATGNEQVRLKIDGQTVKTWNDVSGDYNNGVFENLNYTHSAVVDITQIIVEFSNDGLTTSGADKNLRLDGVSVDGVDYQAESANVYSSGHWVSGSGCSAGFLQIETLECGGFFDFNSTTYSAGGLKLATNLVNVDESAGSTTLTVLRELGSTGTVTVDYRAFANTATAGEDFTLVDGTLTFDDGQTAKTITVPIIDDLLVEGEERFSVTIDNPTGGAALLSPRTAQIVINDDDSPAANSLLGYWKFDESDVGTVLNATGSNNSGTHINMNSGTSGPIAQSPLLDQPNPRSLNFDGLNDYVRITGNPNLNFTGGTFTISAWIKPEFTDATTRGVYSGNNAFYPEISVVDGTKVAVQFGNGSTSSTVTTGSVLQPNDWNQIAVSFDGTLMQVYVDGVVQQSFTEFAGFVPVAATNVDIGRRPAGYFKGQIDEVQVYDRSLSAAEIAELAVDQRDDVSVEVIATYGGAGSIDWTPDGDKMFIGDIAGVVRIFEDGSFLPTPFIDISDQVNATRGMLDIAVHPDFVNNPYVYLAFGYDPPEVNQNSGLAGPDGAGNRASRLIRVTADVDNNYQTAVPGSEVILLGKNSIWQYYNGFVDSTVDFDEPQGGVLPDGSYVQDFLAADSVTHTIDDILFGPDGMLYVSNGDGASYNQVDPRAARVQDIDSLSGKVLRIDPLTGEGLTDNPFYNGDVNANRSKVYYLGLRNPYRMNFSPNDGLLYVGDVGWFQYEELNAGAPGTNFGWPFYEGGTVDAPLQTISYQDLPEAIAFYASGVQTSGGVISLNHADDAIDAIIAGDFYDGTVYDASYNGDFFYNHFGSGFVRQVSFKADGTIDTIQTFADNMGSIVHMPIGPDGHMYFVDIASGVIGRWVIS